MAITVTTDWHLGSAATQSVTSRDDWSDLGNLYADDAAYATVFATLANDGSEDFYVTGFGFELPANAKVLGVQIALDKGANSSGVLGERFQLCQGTTPKGTNQWDGSGLTNDAFLYVYGGTSDLLGWTDITAADVNNANFGINARLGTSVSLRQIFVDYVAIKVTYQYEPDGLMFADVF